MEERRRRLLVVIVAVTVLCGGVVVEMAGASSTPAVTDGINAAARERAAEHSPWVAAETSDLSTESTLIVDADPADGVRIADHPVPVRPAPGASTQSSTSCSEVDEDGSQTCITLTVGPDPMPTELPYRVLVPPAGPPSGR